jgi:L-lactate utilization protein LutC
MTLATASEPTVASNRFDEAADDATIARTASALRGKGYEVHVVDDHQTAKALLLSLVPEGAEVSEGASRTFDELGVTAAIEESGRFDAVRPRTRSMDRNDPAAMREARKVGVAPDYWLNSAHAVTEDGTIVIASNTGSQLGAIAFGAGQVIFAIGSQKIVKNLDEALKRIEDYVLPLENERMQGLYGVNSAVRKILIVKEEFRPGRFTVVLIKEPIGF